MKKFIVLSVVSILATLYCFGETVELLTTEYQPFCGVKGNTVWCELVNTAFAREGVDVTWKSYPQDREKLLVSEGTNVAFLSSTLVIAQDEKPSFLMNANPLIYLDVVAFYPKAKYPSGLGIKSANDLKGKTVGAILGTGSVGVLQKAGAVIDTAQDKDILMGKLVAGRYDLAVVGDLTGLTVLKNSFPDRANAFKYEMVYDSPIDLIFSAKNPSSAALKAKYDSGMAKIKADGSYLKILAKYYPQGNINKSVLPKDMQ